MSKFFAYNKNGTSATTQAKNFREKADENYTSYIFLKEILKKRKTTESRPPKRSKSVYNNFLMCYQAILVICKYTFCDFLRGGGGFTSYIIKKLVPRSSKLFFIRTYYL